MTFASADNFVNPMVNHFSNVNATPMTKAELFVLPNRHAPGRPRRAHRLQGLVQLRQIDLGDGLQFGQRGFEFFRRDAVLLMLRLGRAERGEADALNDGVDALINRRRRDVAQLAPSAQRLQHFIDLVIARCNLITLRWNSASMLRSCGVIFSAPSATTLKVCEPGSGMITPPTRFAIVTAYLPGIASSPCGP